MRTTCSKTCILKCRGRLIAMALEIPQPSSLRIISKT
jgi:hypothetical protein